MGKTEELGMQGVDDMNQRPVKQQKVALSASALSQFQGESLKVMLSGEGLRPEGGGEKNKNCHYCEHAPKRCSNVACGECDQIFCGNCCKRHLKETELGAQGWRCPICRIECCCTKKVCNKPHLHCKRYRRRIKQEERKAQQAGLVRNAIRVAPLQDEMQVGSSRNSATNAGLMGGNVLAHRKGHGLESPSPMGSCSPGPFAMRHMSHAPPRSTIRNLSDASRGGGVAGIDSSSPCTYEMGGTRADFGDDMDERGCKGRAPMPLGIMMHRESAKIARKAKPKDYELFLSRSMASHGASLSLQDSWVCAVSDPMFVSLPKVPRGAGGKGGAAAREKLCGV